MSTTTKNRFRKAVAFFALLLLVLFAFVLVACDSEDKSNKPNKPDTPPAETEYDENTVVPEGSALVTVYYLRLLKDYNNWNVWIWPDGGNGAAYNFTKDVELEGHTWKKLTTMISGVSLDVENPIGFIVRKGNWEEKDPDMDRHITADKFTDRKATIYVAQGVEDVFDDAATAVDVLTSHRITAVSLTGFKSVEINTDSAITNKSVFKLIDSEENVVATIDCSTVSSVVGKKKATFTLENDIDLTKTYTVKDDPANFDKEVNFIGATLDKAPIYTKQEFLDRYQYEGELGAIYSSQNTVFKVWTPAATALKVNIYDNGSDGEPATQIDMTSGEKGVWSATADGDLNGKYYTYSVTVGGSTKEVVDPYARSGGADGKRGMILNLAATNPEGWNDQSIPDYDTTEANLAQAVIYEAHLRDLTIHSSSNVTAANRGKFLGLTEEGTANAPTPLDYLKALGVTTVHFQPLFDFATVKEDFTAATYNKDGEYNWGYDPLNYNMPEGSYSSDPADGAKRVNEMKQMIMALHNAGIQVVMDVVYNHVSNAQTSNFEALVPGYYFRMNKKGGYSNGSGCGNETASERGMFRKFMIDSVLYWTEEYKIDGFRFDLMALHDVETMNELYDAVQAINPDVVIYGEGWTGGTSAMPSSSKPASQANARQMPHIAVFNDIIRDGVKGGVFDMKETGFVTGKLNKESTIYVGALGATNASDVTKIYTSIAKSSFAGTPVQGINYVSCHDNSTLWDKMNASVNKDNETLLAMYRMAAVSVMTSQGASFFLAGEELMRSKPTTETNDYDNRSTAYLTDTDYYFSDNSYRSPDSVNAINWDLSDEQKAMVEFYKELIKIKKTFAQFHFTTTADLKECFVLVDDKFTDGVAVYAIKDPGSNKYAVVIFNAKGDDVTVSIPNGSYTVYVNGSQANAEGIESKSGSSIAVGKYSAVVMTAELTEAAISGWEYSIE